MIELLVALLVLAGLMFYLGFTSRKRTLWRWIPYASLVVCAPLVAVVAQAAWQERVAIAQLSSFIVPYTPISVVDWAPAVPAGGNRHWIVMTPDPPARVVAFYEDAGHRPGWDLLERGSSMLLLKKQAACLSILFNRQPGIRGGTSIVYALVPRCS